jgi:hypothetical protein
MDTLQHTLQHLGASVVLTCIDADKALVIAELDTLQQPNKEEGGEVLLVVNSS